MATRVELTLHEANDEQLNITITPAEAGDDLSMITLLELYLKTSPEYEDNDPSTVVLTSGNVAEIDIITQGANQIVAEAFIPAADLADPYDRFWRIDTLNGSGDRRTAMYGPVEVVNL